MGKIIKRIDVTAIFPGGREVKGFIRSFPNGQQCEAVLQVWTGEDEGDSHLINTRLAESVHFVPTYEN